ncbi:MAG: signal peptidase I [bacterium]|nr:signal peptidase I [bacterium]
MNIYLRRLGSFILDVLQSVVLALALFMLAYLFAFQPHQVRGRSMIPSFQDGEYLLTDKVSYRTGVPKRGDVIVFAAPPNRNEDFIKRIIALPRETVSIKDTKIYINNKLVEESYLPQTTNTLPGLFLSEGRSFTLGSDEYFVMGDNRDHSSDSRTWGPIKRGDIVGRAWVVYWPPQDAGPVPTVSYAGF